MGRTLAGLIRYQCLWRSLLTDPRWDVQDAVARFGFADQAHLLRSFKKYHGLTPDETACRMGVEKAYLARYLPQPKEET